MMIFFILINFQECTQVGIESVLLPVKSSTLIELLKVSSMPTSHKVLKMNIFFLFLKSQ